MKLLVVLPSYEPGWKYGSGVVSSMSALCRGIAAIGESVTVYTTNASGTDTPLDVPLEKPIQLGGVTVYYFKSTFGSKTNFDSRDLIKHLWKTAKNYDCIYVAALWQWLGIDTARICKKLNVPMIIGIHGGFSVKLRKKSYIKKNVFKMFFLQNALNSAIAIHLTSRAEKRDAGDWLDNLPIFYSPNAVDPDRYYPIPDKRNEFRNKYNIPIDVPVLISVGRPDWEKRIDLLIGALIEAKKWYFVFVGKDDYGKGPEWKQYAENLGVHKRIIWTGYLSNEKLLFALSAADLFSLVSENENFGMAVVEAMMCGLPVMLPKSVGVYEMIKDEPFTITITDSVKHIAEALSNFDNQRKTKKIDHNYIRQIAVDKFSPQVIAKEFLYEVNKFLQDKTTA